MTMIQEREDLAVLTDTELAAQWCRDDADTDALRAEEDRREQARRRASSARNGRWIREGDWYGFAHAQFLQAEAECEGYLVNNRGRYRRNEHGQPDPVDAWSLWNGSQWAVDAWASSGLLRFWERNPRITRAEWARQEARARREEISDQLDKDERDAVRCDSGADEESAGDRGDGRRNAFPGPDARAENAEADPGARADGRGSSPVQPVIVLTEESPVTVIPGPDPVEAARARLARRAAELAAERAGRPVAVPAMSVPVPEPVSPAAVAVRPAGTVVAPPRNAGVDGARALSLTAMYLRYYVGMPGEAKLGQERPATLAAADAVALWAAHAVAREAGGAEGRKGTLIWNASPRLLLTSEVNGSGKSSVLDLLASLCHCEFGRQSKVSGPAFAALMGDYHETALLDEAKKIFGAGKAAQELQSHLLNGYTRNGKSLVMRGGKLCPSVVWGPVAYAGKKELITDTRDELADLLARSIVMSMGRPDRYYPEIGATAHGEGMTLGAALAAWATQERATLLARADELARETEGLAVAPDKAPRGVQLWRPLLAIADVAGMASRERDGHGDECGCLDCRWPERAREACAMLSGTAATEEDSQAAQAFAGLEGKFGDLGSLESKFAQDPDNWAGAA